MTVEECPATGTRCVHEPNGPHGHTQCKYCGDPKSGKYIQKDKG